MKGIAECGHEVDETEYVQNKGLCTACALEMVRCDACGNLVNQEEYDSNDGYCNACAEKVCPQCGQIANRKSHV